MPDLKAAAERLRNMAKQRRGEIQFFVGMEQSENRIAAEADDYLLAAQALGALAWQGEVGAKVKQCWSGERWFCEVADGEYVADTPLGALLAAMEGESDGKA